MGRIVALVAIAGLAIVALAATRLVVNQSTVTRAESQVGSVTASPISTPTPTLVASPSPTSRPIGTSRVISNLLANDDPKPTFKPKIVPFTNPLPVLNPEVIFGDINLYRAEHGKPTLEQSTELCKFANARAGYMIANNMAAFLTSENGKHTGLAAQTRGYSGKGIGENLAALVTSDAEALGDWKNSEAHNSLLLATEIDGVPITNGCVATKVANWGSIVVFLAGDK